MANNPSAKKRVRQNEKSRKANQSNRSKMRSFVKAIRNLVKAGEISQAKEKLPTTISVIDKTAKKGAIKKTTANRYKSRLAQFVKKADLAAAK